MGRFRKRFRGKELEDFADDELSSFVIDQQIVAPDPRPASTDNRRGAIAVGIPVVLRDQSDTTDKPSASNTWTVV